MFSLLFILFASLGTLYGSPVDSTTRSLPPNIDSLLVYTRDTSTGASCDQRTTYGIVWSCVLTILACVWSAVHPNIPGPYDAGLTIFKRRMTTTFCSLLAPEALVMWALRQHFAAKYIMEEYNREIVGQDSTLVLSDTKGVAFKWPASTKKAVNEGLMSAKESIHEWLTKLPNKAVIRRKPRLIKSKQPLSDREAWTMTHAFFVQMGGFMLYEDEKPKKVLEFDTMCKMIKAGEIPAPTVTEAGLKDRSKGDALSKCIIVLQTSWFVAQCLARLASRLPLSELEVVTLAFAVMNGIVYWVWWDKPQGVDIAIPIHLHFPDGHGSNFTEAAAVHDAEKASQLLNDTLEGTTAQDTSSLKTLPSEESFKRNRGMSESPPLSDPQGKIGSSMSDMLRTSTHSTLSARLWRDLAGNLWNNLKSFPEKIFNTMAYPITQLDNMLQDSHIPDGATTVPTFYAYKSHSNSINSVAIAAILIGVLFGAVHFFAWPSVFASPAERIMWRVSTLVTTTGPLFLLLAAYIEDRAWLGDVSKPFSDLLSVVTAVAYIMGRIALVAVALLSLRALPKDVFVQISWTAFIPHL